MAGEEDHKTELVTICPGFTVGPPIYNDNFVSSGWLKRLMEGRMESISHGGYAVSDVRDVALAHYNAIKVEEAANKRFILVANTPSFHDIARPIVDKYKNDGWAHITDNY